MESRTLSGRRAVTHFYKYIVVGSLATVVDLVVFVFLTGGLSLNYLLATTISVIVATAVKFSLCLRFVFTLRQRSPTLAWWYQLSTSFLALFANLMFMYLLVDVLSFDQLTIMLIDGLLWARAITTAVVFLFNFSMSKYLVFRDY